MIRVSPPAPGHSATPVDTAGFKVIALPPLSWSVQEGVQAMPSSLLPKRNNNPNWKMSLLSTSYFLHISQKAPAQPQGRN
jgi:hypothetical protein